MLFVNNVPVIDPLRDSTLSRLATIQFQYSFVDNPTLPYEKKRDPNFKTALCDNHQFRDAFIHLIMDECHPRALGAPSLSFGSHFFFQSLYGRSIDRSALRPRSFMVC